MEQQLDLQNAITQLQDALVCKTDLIIQLLASQTGIHGEMISWIGHANQLKLLVPQYAIPHWLSEGCEKFNMNSTGNLAVRNNFAVFVTYRAPEIRQPILIGDVAALNIEQLFVDQSTKYNLNDVFENLVGRLSDLIAADVIDNRLVNDSLSRLNALFRRSKNGSLSTVLLTMNFGRFFLRSFGGVLKANKYAKPIIESFEAEFAEASSIVQKAEEETKKEMVSRLINSQRMDLFIESNPGLRETIAGFLPAPNAEEKSVTAAQPKQLT